jgi:hypothetical protein
VENTAEIVGSDFRVQISADRHKKLLTAEYAESAEKPPEASATLAASNPVELDSNGGNT